MMGFQKAAEKRSFVSVSASEKMKRLQKEAAETPTLSQKAYSLLGWDDQYYPTNPVAAMLATGILGAGLGYGGASLASYFLPNTWDKRKFRRTGAALGAAAGAAPGALEAVKSLLVGRPLLVGDHMTREGLKKYAKWEMFDDEKRLVKIRAFNVGLSDTLDLSGCEALEKVALQFIKNLTTLNVSGCVNLQHLGCNDMSCLTTLNVSGCKSLIELWCCCNKQLTAIDVSSCSLLRKMMCNNCQIAALDLSANALLKELDCSWNKLTTLILSNRSDLQRLECLHNQLTELNLFCYTDLAFLDCRQNGLNVLNVTGSAVVRHDEKCLVHRQA